VPAVCVCVCACVWVRTYIVHVSMNIFVRVRLYACVSLACVRFCLSVGLSLFASDLLFLSVCLAERQSVGVGPMDSILSVTSALSIVDSVSCGHYTSTVL
jgi:hypothetical protein